MPDETIDPTLIETGVDVDTAAEEVVVEVSDEPELAVETGVAPVSFEGQKSH